MLSCSPSSNFNQNLYARDFYTPNNRNIDNFTLNKLIKEESYDQLFGINDPFFGNFLAEYNNGREYEKSNSLNENLNKTELPKLLLINHCDSNFEAVSPCGSDQSDFLGLSTSHSLIDLNQNSFASTNYRSNSTKRSCPNDYLKPLKNSVPDYLDTESIDSAYDRTLVAENDESPNKTLFDSPRKKLSSRKKNSPSSVKRSSKTIEDNSPKKSHKYSNRHRFKEFQIEILEKEFQKDQYPSGIVIDGISSSLGVSYHTIAVWFQNRRARFKRSIKIVKL